MLEIWNVKLVWEAPTTSDVEVRLNRVEEAGRSMKAKIMVMIVMIVWRGMVLNSNQIDMSIDL